MEEEVAIQFKNVTKGFYLQIDKTFKEAIPNLLLRRPWAKKLIALSDISFTINKGEIMGIIGKNGAGKSTILKLIAGVTAPSKGQVIINGKVAPMIELGAGFHHELTGYENIFLNAAILGMHKKEIELAIDKIIEFSELAEFIHSPVKQYSSGMYMRLAFSIAIHIDAPILLVDEVLAVGDEDFKKKCLKRLNEIKSEHSKTIIFVSHDEKMVKEFCDRVLLLSGGKILEDGSPDKAFEIYHKL